MFTHALATAKNTTSGRPIARECKRKVSVKLASEVPEIGQLGVVANLGLLYEMVGIESWLSGMDKPRARIKRRVGSVSRKGTTAWQT
jgi:hypothetical protein